MGAEVACMLAAYTTYRRGRGHATANRSSESENCRASAVGFSSVTSMHDEIRFASLRCSMFDERASWWRLDFQPRIDAVHVYTELNQHVRTMSMLSSDVKATIFV
jgi:hypothetical protein